MHGKQNPHIEMVIEVSGGRLLSVCACLCDCVGHLIHNADGHSWLPAYPSILKGRGRNRWSRPRLAEGGGRFIWTTRNNCAVTAKATDPLTDQEEGETSAQRDELGETDGEQREERDDEL